MTGFIQNIKNSIEYFFKQIKQHPVL